MRYLRFFSAVVALLIFSVDVAEDKAAPDPEPEDLSEAVNKLEELVQLKGKSINKRFPQLLWRGTEQKTLYCPGTETKKFRYGEENVYGFQIEVADQQIKSLKITIFTRGDAGKIEATVAAANPDYFDILPLSLEEIFIYELGGVNYEVKNIVL